MGTFQWIIVGLALSLALPMTARAQANLALPPEVEAAVISKVRSALGVGPEVRVKLWASDAYYLDGLKYVSASIKGSSGLRCLVRGSDVWCGAEALPSVIKAYSLAQRPRQLNELEWLSFLSQAKVADCVYGSHIGRVKAPKKLLAKIDEPKVIYPEGGGLLLECTSVSSGTVQVIDQVRLELAPTGALKQSRTRLHPPKRR